MNNAFRILGSVADDEFCRFYRQLNKPIRNRSLRKCERVKNKIFRVYSGRWSPDPYADPCEIAKTETIRYGTNPPVAAVTTTDFYSHTTELYVKLIMYYYQSNHVQFLEGNNFVY